ncbi:amino acid ABC transporter substrate-binding protein [Thalassotalea euphylliae]|uniref:amino acid ABC transporter substrate-binding protein n=1 Tax=Thalassotalea euphylliae TaxID=1655234 RepID=UPI0036399B0B
MPKVFKSALLLLTLSLSWICNSEEKVITLGVGPDHHEMLSQQYDIYRANWEFIGTSLAELGYTVEASPLPWARAKLKVQSGELHGLFIAAKFVGRDAWAAYTQPIGYEVYGSFINTKSNNTSKTGGAVRLGGQDRVVSHKAPEDLLYVPTAQQGLKLLAEDKITHFYMAKGYGRYLLANELKPIADNLVFSQDKIEPRSLHIAVSQKHEESLSALALLNKAINNGVNNGSYHVFMAKYSVPKDMQLPKLSK